MCMKCVQSNGSIEAHDYTSGRRDALLMAARTKAWPGRSAAFKERNVSLPMMDVDYVALRRVLLT